MAPQERDGLSTGSDLEVDKILNLYFNSQKSHLGTSIEHSLSTAMHLNEHYVHKCPHCTYTSKTEGRLKRHEKEFHSATPPDSWVSKRSSKKDTMKDQSVDSSVKSSYKKACKKCEFVAYQESEYWIHKKIHLKPEKILQCPQCEFCTDLKQHYDYHISNHTGSKPFKCKECDYKSINKSMLNSHLKCHSSVSQFHCADCSYETKYCHSIKEHLKKKNHRPGIVLNQDGTPCPHIVIDVYGKRRGPRANKRKFLEISENNYDNTFASSNQAPTSNQGLAFPTDVPLVQQNNPILKSNFLNFQRDLFSAQINNCNFSLPRNVKQFPCRLCTFVTDDQEMSIKHIFRHMAAENDIVNVYRINLELMRGQEMAINGDTNGLYNFAETEQYQRVPSDYSAINESHNFKQVYNERMADVKYEEEKNSRKFRRLSVQKYSDKNNSLKGFSSPSPPGSTNYSSDMEIFMDKSSADRSSPGFVPEVNRMEDNESPIDLSGRSSSDSIKTNRSSKNLEGPLQSTNQIISICAPLNRSSSASQRNRRKGIAYRIDQYLQYDDQSPLAEEKEPQERCSNNDSNLLQKSERQSQQSTVRKVSFDLLNRQDVVSKTQESVHDTSKCTLAKANEGIIEPIAMLSNKNFQKASKINHCTLHDNQSPLAEEKEMYNNTALNPPQKGVMLSEKDQLFDDYSKLHKCVHCGIFFESLIMYTIHKGYHTLENPFCCNSCGHISKDREEFYAHILKCN